MNRLSGDFFVVLSPQGGAAMVIKLTLDSTRCELSALVQRYTGLDLMSHTPEYVVTWDDDMFPQGWRDSGDFWHSPLVDHRLQVGSNIRLEPMATSWSEWTGRALHAEEVMLRVFEPRYPTTAWRDYLHRDEVLRTWAHLGTRGVGQRDRNTQGARYLVYADSDDEAA